MGFPVDASFQLCGLLYLILFADLCIASCLRRHVPPVRVVAGHRRRQCRPAARLGCSRYIDDVVAITTLEYAKYDEHPSATYRGGKKRHQMTLRETPPTSICTPPSSFSSPLLSIPTPCQPFQPSCPMPYLFRPPHRAPACSWLPQAAAVPTFQALSL